MTRMLLVTLAVGFTLAIAAPGQEAPKFDPKIFFLKLDVNKDGKLSRREFDSFMPKQTAAIKTRSSRTSTATATVS